MFGCCESDLDDLYWRYDYMELKKRLSLHVGYTTATHMAQFSTLVSVVSTALGGGKKSADNTKDLRDLPPDQLVAQINRLGSL